jgi:putative addiction module component (TIGR02574 family)
MSGTTQTILREALALPPLERAEFADALLSSLDRPDPAIDAMWAAEAEERIKAFDAGDIKAVYADEVLAELDSM